MEQYISKSAIAAEIERRLEAISNSSNEDNRELAAIRGAQQFELINLALFLNTLEVKEVNSNDALIEKACVKLKKLMYDNLMFQGRWHREEVIDNFIEDFKNYFESDTLFRYYDSDTIEITSGMEPQVAVLKFIGVNEQPSGTGEKKEKGTGLLRKLWKR